MFARGVLLSLGACGGGSGAAPAAAPAETASAAPVAEAPAVEDALEGPEEHPLEVKGTLGDDDYKPVVAVASSAFRKDGRLFVVLELFETERKCDTLAKPKAGDRQVMMSVPWQSGAKLDLAMPPPDESFNPNKMKRWTGERWDPVDAWKAPFGSVEVFEAPTKSGEKGRVRLKVRVGRLKLRGDLPVLLCVDAR